MTRSSSLFLRCGSDKSPVSEPGFFTSILVRLAAFACEKQKSDYYLDTEASEARLVKFYGKFSFVESGFGTMVRQPLALAAQAEPETLRQTPSARRRSTRP